MIPRREPPAIVRGAALACALVASCADREPYDVTVLAAASLSEAFTEIAAAYETAHPRAEVALELAASSTLAAQVRAGAPFDVLATADERTMEQARRVELVERPVAFATNRMVVIAGADDPAGVRTVEDLARPGTRVVLAQQDVPAGAYARRANEPRRCAIGPDTPEATPEASAPASAGPADTRRVPRSRPDT